MITFHPLARPSLLNPNHHHPIGLGSQVMPHTVQFFSLEDVDA